MEVYSAFFSFDATVVIRIVVSFAVSFVVTVKTNMVDLLKRIVFAGYPCELIETERIYLLWFSKMRSALYHP